MGELPNFRIEAVQQLAMNAILLIRYNEVFK